MSKSNGNDTFPLLESLASGWLAGRGCTVAQDSVSKSGEKLSAEGPGFIYRWDDSHDPVVISFLPDGKHEVVSGRHRHLLFIGAGEDGISIKAPHRHPHVIKTGDRSTYQQLREITKEAVHCSEPHCTETCDKLTTINAAQRFVALGHAAHNFGQAEKKGARISAKHRFVTELHAWLANELENSVKLGDAAKHFGKSPRQLIRVLKETTGSGFAEHLTMHRLLLARTLLMRTDASIMEVAKKSGFNSREQFIRSFSKTFLWTPLQYRKAWNKASLSNSDLAALCQIADRKPVDWLPHGDTDSPTSCEMATPNTLVVANALHEIVELFSIDPSGKRERAGLLDRGSMSFINRDTAGSKWLVRTSGSEFVRCFVTPEHHAIAVISPELRNGKSKRAAG